MPSSKPLRQPAKRQGSASSLPRRKTCPLCHNLDPRGHSNTIYQSEGSKDATASLTLVIDAFELSRTKAPVDKGCRFCDVVVQALDTFCADWRGARRRVVVDIKEKGTIKVNVDGDRWKGEAVEIYAASASRAPWPTLGTAHHIPTNAGSDDTFNFARRCIQDCLTNSRHTLCRSVPKPSPTTTPKRLLDVGRVTAPIRLIDTSGKNFEYATLSHKWGSGPNLSATKSNWQKLSRNIPFESLPSLFQDAIIITRQLGLRYIWIDSLCIIQDSQRDWETESSKMGAIYENSYITISATNCEDGSERCLVDRRKPVQIQYTNTTGKECNVRARRILEQHPMKADAEPAKPAGPLMSRAWALQEHVLSTRILHYTATELLFECKTSYRCECMPLRKPYPTTPALIPKAVSKPGGDRWEVWSAWQKVVEQYSGRGLTVGNDKLPALSGVAAKIKDATGSGYIAGIWKDNLASDLIWSVSTNAVSNANSAAPDNYRAPSFSWASLDAEISYYAPDEDERASFSSTITLLSSFVSLSGLNPLGAVGNAGIKVRGPSLIAFLSSLEKDSNWTYTLFIKGTSAIPLTPDSLLVEAETSTDAGQSVQSVQRAQSEQKGEQFKAPVLCLSVARYDSWIAGVVLGVSPQNPSAWQRLGTFAAGTEVFSKAEVKDILIV